MTVKGYVSANKTGYTDKLRAQMTVKGDVSANKTGYADEDNVRAPAQQTLMIMTCPALNHRGLVSCIDVITARCWPWPRPLRWQITIYQAGPKR